MRTNNDNKLGLYFNRAQIYIFIYSEIQEFGFLTNK